VRSTTTRPVDNRTPFPRHPWDPRAVSDPRLILDEFPDRVRDPQIGPGATADQSEQGDGANVPGEAPHGLEADQLGYLTFLDPSDPPD
jgi:hypothetical protein